jgi:hypothetical protein
MTTSRTTQTHYVGSKLGGIAAIIIGLVNIVLVVYVIGATGAERYDAGAFFEYFSKSPLALSVAWIFIVMTSILIYAVIPVVKDLVEPVNRDWTRFATLYGIAGFTVMGVWAITLTRLMPELSRNYVAGSQPIKDAIVAYGLHEIDPDGWFSFGGPGTWLIIVNILAIRGRKLHTVHALAGIMLGIGLWATVFGALFSNEPLNLFAAGTATLFYPIWCVWLGIIFIRDARTIDSKTAEVN